MWVLGMELRVPDVTASIYTNMAILPALYFTSTE